MRKVKFFINDTDWAASLERELDDYLNNCFGQVDGEQENPDFETESGISYCGCSDCHSREVVVFLTPRIIQAYKDGKVSLA
jgi:hypothetical protein